MPRWVGRPSFRAVLGFTTVCHWQERFARNEIDTILNARVKEVTPDKVIYTTKNADGSLTEHELDSGFTLWSTGIGG